MKRRSAPAAHRQVDAPEGRSEGDERRFRLLDQKIQVLERERQKLSAVVHHTDAGFLAFDAALKVVWSNTVFAARFWAGASAGTLLGQSCHRVLCRRTAACEECPTALLFKTGSVAHHEMRLEIAGRLRHIYATAVPIRSLAGEVDEAIVMLQDVSDLEVLRQSEARKGAILNTALDAILTINHLGIVGEFNQAAEAMFGYSRSEALGKEIAELIIPPSLRSRHREGLARHLRTGESRIIGQRLEMPAMRKDGSEFPVEIVISHIPLAGGPIFTGYIRDLSERKAAEQALRESQEHLRQAQKMEAVGRLAGGIAHDFNNLLTAITGQAQLMQRSMEEGAPLRPKLDEVLKAADRAADLTRQLLAFSRQQVLEPKVLDLNVIVGGVLPMLRRLIGEDIELISIPNPDLAHVRADPGQIVQVIMNLAVNARDAMRDGGRLTLETMNENIDQAHARPHLSTPPGRYVMLSVSDTGAGMDEKTMARIFEPFFTTKEQGKGTGLGLATVYGIVKQSGGYIWVTSEPGQGTTFKVYLPRVDDEMVEAGPPPRPADALRGTETILVVEDEELVRSLTCEILRAQGYKVLEARHGAHALQLSGDYRDHVDLILTDVVMPRMNGPDLAARIAALRPGIAVLYMTGYADNALASLGEPGGNASCLHKPFTVEGLARKVREVLDVAARAAKRPA